MTDQTARESAESSANNQGSKAPPPEDESPRRAIRRVENSASETLSDVISNPGTALAKRNHKTRERVSYLLVLAIVGVLFVPWVPVNPTVIASILGTVVTLLVIGGQGDSQ